MTNNINENAAEAPQAPADKLSPISFTSSVAMQRSLRRSTFLSIFSGKLLLPVDHKNGIAWGTQYQTTSKQRITTKFINYVHD